VCPENIKITDNALIPMKERVAGRKYDPLVWLGDKIGRQPRKDTRTLAVESGSPAAFTGNGSPSAVIRRGPAAWRCCCSPRPRWACRAPQCGGWARCRPPT
jgi:hypothetical protein